MTEKESVFVKSNWGNISRNAMLV